MTYRVVVTDTALEDISHQVVYIASDSVMASSKWLDELESLVESLAEMPSRFSLIPEARRIGRPYRSALHYSHRVIFRIDEETQTVFVVRVYHGARPALKRRQLPS